MGRRGLGQRVRALAVRLERSDSTAEQTGEHPSVITARNTDRSR